MDSIEPFENLPRRKGNQGKKNPPIFKRVLAAFDIETSNITYNGNTEAIMYIWQLAIEGEPVIIGRTWKEFKRILHLLELGLSGDERMIIFVHNLSFEFQFLKSVLAFEEVFCLNDRKVLKAVSGHIEFRCSLMQTNQPLSSFTRDYKATHYKLSGDEFDYNVKRFPWSRLTDEELSYCVNDVVGLIEAMRNRINAGGDDLNTLPLTSTGYVRREVKRAMRSYYRPKIVSLQPDEELYHALRAAFRGGDTHANRYYTGLIVEGVTSYDITSSYPYVQLSRAYPMTKFIKSTEQWSIEEIRRYKFVYNKAFLLKVTLTGVTLKNKMFGFPYIPIAKCLELVGERNDNGRVLSAESLTMWITDIDLEIIDKEYQFTDAVIEELYISNYGALPEQITNIVFQLFQDKSTLKGVEGQEMVYQLKKAMLNSVYGLTAQDVGKLNFVYQNGNIEVDLTKPLSEILKHAKKNPYLSYQWGVWCTAHARKRLHMGLWAAYEQGAEPLYVDTDSIKYMGSMSWDSVNAECYRVNYSAKTQTGKITTLGTFVFDGAYKRFLTYGAKKYAYEDEKGVHITIAGVSKKKGAEELTARGGLEKLVEGFTFRKSAGAEARYNDHKMIIIDYKGRELELASNVALTESEYTLGITADYEALCYDSRFVHTIKTAIDLLYTTLYN